MSNLSTKILSYSPETYIRFNQAYTLTPTNSGTSGTATFTLTNEAPTYNATGGVHGEGSWAINVGNGIDDLSTTMYRIFSNTIGANVPLTDGNYSYGFWFKTNFTYTTGRVYNPSLLLTQIGGMGRHVVTSLLGQSTSMGKLSFTVSTGGTVNSTNRVDDQQWHYVAVRSFIDASGYHSEIYLDGSYIVDLVGTTTTGTAYAQIGTSVRSSYANTVDLTTFEISDYYIAPYSTIDATAISQIWNARINATNINIAATPITASATMVNPTIAVTTGDHVEITTSILVDATLPSTITVFAAKNVNIPADSTLTASCEMINNVQVSAGTDVLNVVAQMTADAALIEPVLPVAPFTASAVSGDHSVYVTPNYFNLVKSASPLFYTNLEDSTITNFGSWSGVTYTVGSTVAKNVASGGDMALIAGGESWKFTGNYNNAPNYVRIIPADTNNTLGNLALNDFTLEYWFKPTVVQTGVGMSIGKYSIYYTPSTVAGYPNYSQKYANSMAVQVESVQEWDYNPGTPINLGTYKTFAAPENSIIFNDWNHIVMKTNGSVVALYINGSYAAGGSFVQNNWAASIANWDYVSITGSPDPSAAQQLFDEVAIYDTELSNSQIIDHYSFIFNQSPDRYIFPAPLTATADSGTHNFTITSNVNYAATPITASAVFTNPIVVASKVIEVTATALTASAQSTSATVYWGWTINAATATSYAESTNAFRLNDSYYNYVQTNIAPYRYVTFDGNNSYADYGTDNDYAVVPVAIGGTVVNPDLGINGKSVKTAGTSYATDGVILKESEWNDTWGTGLNNYHSSFWFKKADEDVSTGLRVLWNLNGYYDNQHVILYQYQNKLHLQFNNGSGTFIDQATTSNYDLFDGNRHFVVIAFDHTGNNSYVNLFVDAVDIMTVNLGSYNGSTVNGVTSVPANDEANNHPRLSVGCLITPFGSTALPVVPTNTIIIADEIIWAKSSATQNVVNGLYAAMPDQSNKIILAGVFASNAVMTSASVSTTAVIVPQSMNSNSEIIDANISVVFNNIINVSALTASAIINMPTVSVPAYVLVDVMLASASIASAGVKITLPGGPMNVTALIPNNRLNGIRINDIPIYNSMSPWATWLRATDVSSIYPTREVV